MSQRVSVKWYPTTAVPLNYDYSMRKFSFINNIIYFKSMFYAKEFYELISDNYIIVGYDKICKEIFINNKWNKVESKYLNEL